jgi:hypothetical protein
MTNKQVVGDVLVLELLQDGVDPALCDVRVSHAGDLAGNPDGQGLDPDERVWITQLPELPAP